MKIFLVDFFVNGHHVVYAAHIGRYLLEKGHEVTFVTWRSDDRLQLLSDIGLNVCYVGGHRALASDTLHMIPQFANGLRICLDTAKKSGATVVHFLYLDRALLVPLWWTSLWCESESLLFATLYWPYHFIDSAHLNPLERLYHRIIRTTLKALFLNGKLSSLFVHSQHIKEIVLRALRTDCLENRLIVVPDPLPDLRFTPGEGTSKETCRVRLGLPQKRVVVLFFGELRESKGPDILLKAVKLLPPNVLIVFAGAPAGVFSLRDWEQEVKREGLDGQIRLDLGHVPDELVPVFFGAADAIAMPYRRSFLGTSGVLQWAAAAQKPVVATDVGEVGDLVKRNRLGLVVEPENSERFAQGIVHYMREREVIDRSIVESASDYRSLNHWRRTGECVLAGYESALSS